MATLWLITALAALGVGMICALAAWTAASGPQKLPATEGGLPWVGVALPFFRDVNAFLQNRLKKYGGRPFRLLILGRWWTIVYDKKDIKLVLTARDSELSFLEGFHDLLSGMLPRGFTFVNRHHFFLPVLRSPDLKVYAALMHEEARRQVGGWGSTGALGLFETCRRLVMRMNLRCLLGPAVFEEGRFERYYAAFQDIDPEKGLVNILTSYFGPNKKEKAWSNISTITVDILKHYQATAGQAERATTDQSRPECVLDMLVQGAKAEGRHLDEGEVTADIFAFVFASFTNTFAVLAWSMHELAGRPDVLARVRAETAGKDLSDLSSVEGMVVTKAVVDEVIRKRTPGLVFRKVVKPGGVQLSTGECVPCGDFLAFSARHVSHLEEFYSSPTEFDVDRSLPPREEHKAAGPYWIAWGSGRHQCLGAKFAAQEIAITLGVVFGRYHLVRQAEEPVVSKAQLGTVDKPLKPLHVQYRKLEASEEGIE